MQKENHQARFRFHILDEDSTPFDQPDLDQRSSEQSQASGQDMFGQPDIFGSSPWFNEPVSILSEIHSSVMESKPQCSSGDKSVSGGLADRPQPCRCTKIQCDKKYCECFRKGRKCTKYCLCTKCCNQPTIKKLTVGIENFWAVSHLVRDWGNSDF